MAIILLLLAPYFPPLDHTVHVDVIEWNRVRWPAGSGQGDFDQLIFWEWTLQPEKYGVWCGRYDVIDYRVITGCCRPQPWFDHGRRQWSVAWWENGRRIRVIARSYRETTTSFDVEMDQRNELAKRNRRGLR